MPTSSSTPIPHGATAQRPGWPDLPPSIRHHIEERLGGPVVAVANQGSGFAPGFASRIAYTDGRAFVKAAHTRSTPTIAESYRAEARVVPLLPSGVPAPRLRWTSEHDGWVLFCYDDVPGRPPRRPWQPTELTRALTVLLPMSEALAARPESLVLPGAHEWMRTDFGYWEEIAADRGASRSDRITELAALDALAAEAVRGDAIVHCDLRPDNMIVADDGAIWICDWSWCSRGAPWLDLVTLLLSAWTDGFDANALFTAHPLGADAEPEAVDAVLAGLAGYFTRSSLETPLSSSPHLRTHQAACAEAALSWLAVRRGWTARTP
jgi:hypothetical protein